MLTLSNLSYYILYDLLVCQNKIDLSLFEHATQSFNDENRAIRYSRLSKIIDGCEYTSVIIKTVRENER